MKQKGALYALLGGAIWGFSGTCGQFLFANSSLDAMSVTWIRLWIGGIVLTVYSLLTQREQVYAILHHKKDALRCVLFAFAGLMTCQLSYLETIQYSNSGTATVFQYSGILFILIVTCLLQKRLPLRKELCAVLLVLIGVFFVATHGQWQGLVISRQAFFWGLIASVTMLLYSMLPGHLLERYGPSNVLGWAMLMAGTVLTVFVQPWSLTFDWSWDVVLVLFVIILFGTILAFTFYLTGVSQIGAMRASMIACVEPVVATLTSAFWLHTKFLPMDLAGFFCIVLGVLLVNYQKQNKNRV